MSTFSKLCRETLSFTISLCIFLALCPATNLTGQVSCETNTLNLTWDQSPVSGATYILQTERIGGAIPPSVNTTSYTSHTLTNLLCGQRYAFRIAAQDGNCRSSYSPPIEISTGRMCFYGNSSKSFTCCSREETYLNQFSSSLSPLPTNQPHCSCGLWDKQREFLLG